MYLKIAYGICLRFLTGGDVLCNYNSEAKVGVWLFYFNKITEVKGLFKFPLYTRVSLAVNEILQLMT